MWFVSESFCLALIYFWLFISFLVNFMSLHLVSALVFVACILWISNNFPKKVHITFGQYLENFWKSSEIAPNFDVRVVIIILNKITHDCLDRRYEIFFSPLYPYFFLLKGNSHKGCQNKFELPQKFICCIFNIWFNMSLINSYKWQDYLFLR